MSLWDNPGQHFRVTIFLNSSQILYFTGNFPFYQYPKLALFFLQIIFLNLLIQPSGSVMLREAFSWHGSGHMLPWRGESLQINTKYFVTDPLYPMIRNILYDKNISILIGMVCSRITMFPSTGHKDSLNCLSMK